MSNSTSRIAAGLAAYDGPAGPSLDRFSKGPRSLNDLVAAAESVSHKYNSLINTLGQLREAEAKALAEVEALADDAKLRGQQRTKFIAESMKARRKEIKANSEEARYAALRELQEIESGINNVAALWESPAHLLAREGIGSEERSRFLNQVQNSGPVELDHFAALAVSMGGKEGRLLGAAVLSRMDALPSDTRKSMTTSRQELSQALCGADHAKAAEAISIVRNRAREAINQNRAYESGRTSGVNAVSDALARRNESGVLEDA